MSDMIARGLALKGVGTRPSKNMFNQSAVTAGFFVNWVFGGLQANSAYCHTNYIAIKPNTTYSQTFFTHLAMYDSNKNYISGSGQRADDTSGNYTPHLTFTTPANAAFIRISMNPSEISGYQFEEGSEPTPPAPYGDALYSIATGQTLKLTAGGGSGIGLANSYQGKLLSTLGDSITAQSKWQPYITQKLAMTLSNHGTGGTKVADTTGSDVQAMCRNERIDVIPELSDVITFMGGTNDWANNVPLGTITDTVTNTFYGALNTVATKLLARFPNKRIIFMTTPYGKFPNRNGWTNTYGLLNNLNLTTSDYADAVAKVAKRRRIPCADIHSLAGWSDDNITHFITDDGAFLHPNTDGGKRIAEVLMGVLKSIEPV